MHSTDTPRAVYTRQRMRHWDATARARVLWPAARRYYHRRLAEIYRFLVAPGQRVLELGCAEGDLLAALRPSVGVGVDFSQEMIAVARRRHPQLTFALADAHNLAVDGKFDIIILSDVVNDLWDVQAVLQTVSLLSGPHTRVILNFYSKLWVPVLTLAAHLRLATRTMPQNWLTNEDLTNLLYLSDLEVVRAWQDILWPAPIPLVDLLLNRFLVRIWPFNQAALTNFIVARARPSPIPEADAPSVSVIVPARNEAGNIRDIFARLPRLGRDTELIFVEGHSRDGTYATIERLIGQHPELRGRLLRQTGVGKGDAVRLGFAHASGDVLMILDADLTMPPEELPRFYQALVSGKGDLINGVRLIYPMEKDAMRLFNFLGNKFFSLAFSWLLGQPIKDTLCGTKVLWKKDYELIAANRSYFGDFDPFGDFDLLFGAARLNLKIVDLPIRYGERSYGTTNIQRWKHGQLLLRMTIFAALRLKFI